MADSGEIALQIVQKRGFHAALKHFGDKRTLGSQNLTGKFHRQFGQTDDAQMIGLLMPCGIGSHVGHDHIGLAAQHGHQPFGRIEIVEVHHLKLHTGDRVDIEQINADDFALSLFGLDAFGRNLRPTARCRPQIDYPPTRFEQVLSVVDLQNFESGARAEALALGTRHIGIIQLAFQPTRLRCRAIS